MNKVRVIIVRLGLGLGFGMQGERDKAHVTRLFAFANDTSGICGTSGIGVSTSGICCIPGR